MQENQHLIEQCNTHSDHVTEMHDGIDIDFETVINELHDLEQTSHIKKDQIELMIQKIKHIQTFIEGKGTENIQNDFNDLLKRILDETQEKLGDLGHFTWYEEALKLLSKSDGKLFTFNDIYGGARARFDNLRKRIHYNKDCVNDLLPQNIVKDLATNGVSETAEILHHEMMHNLHFPNSQYFIKNLIIGLFLNFAELIPFGIVASVLNKQIKFGFLLTLVAYIIYRRYQMKSIKKIANRHKQIYETHAFCEEFLYYSKNNTTKHILDILWKNYNVIATKQDIENVIIIFQGIKRLHALGKTTEEIAKMIQESKINNNFSKLFDEINEKIKRLKLEKNLEDEDVDNLVLLNDLRKKIYVQTVRLIAQKHLRVYYQKILAEQNLGNLSEQTN